jgi:hypothetical protein
MRVVAALWIVGVVAASAGVSAVAFGQASTWGTGTAPRRADAGAAARPPESGANTEEEQEEEEEAEEEEADGGVRTAADAASAASTADAGGAPDGGSNGPSNLGFAIGLRGGYALPFGNANGVTVRDNVAQGAVPIGVDVGWFFTPHLYVGAAFSYGIGVGIGRLNPTCGDPDIDCSAAMYRLGGVAHWHFLPTEDWDPWVGVGLGYEYLQVTATSQVDGSSSNPTSALQGLNVTLEAGLDYKPLRYFGLGPYMEVATGSYIAGTSGFDVHGWGILGARFRLNLF